MSFFLHLKNLIRVIFYINVNIQELDESDLCNSILSINLLSSIEKSSPSKKMFSYNNSYKLYPRKNMRSDQPILNCTNFHMNLIENNKKLFQKKMSDKSKNNKHFNIIAESPNISKNEISIWSKKNKFIENVHPNIKKESYQQKNKKIFQSKKPQIQIYAEQKSHQKLSSSRNLSQKISQKKKQRNSVKSNLLKKNKSKKLFTPLIENNIKPLNSPLRMNQGSIKRRSSFKTNKKILNLDHQNIFDSQLDYIISSSIRSQTEIISLKHNYISVNGLVILLNLLMQKKIKLKELNLSNNQISDNCLNILDEFIYLYPHIKKIFISKNFIVKSEHIILTSDINQKFGCQILL